MDYKVIIIQISNLAWEILKTWWWLPLPVILFFPLRFFYLWYVNNKYWGRIQWVNLELRTPKDVERPLKAMDQVMTNFWTLYDPADFKEKWVEGKFLLPFFLEIAGIDGNVHFFLRIPKSMKTVFESAIYSQYPDVEVTEVEDYIKRVPQNEAKKTQEILEDTTVELQEGDLHDAVVEIRFLALSWLDDFEKELFKGKTIDELLNRGQYD